MSCICLSPNKIYVMLCFVITVLAKANYAGLFAGLEIFESHRDKTSLQGFRPGMTQTGLYSLRRRLEAWNLEFKKKRNLEFKKKRNLQSVQRKQRR